MNENKFTFCTPFQGSFLKICFGKIGVKQEETFVSRNSNVTHEYSEEKFHNNIRTTTLDWSRGTEVPEGNSPGKHFPQ